MHPMADDAVARIQRASVHGGLSGHETWDLIRQELIAAYTHGVQESAAVADALKAALERARSGLEGEHYVTDGGSHSIGYEQRWDETDCPWCTTDPATLEQIRKPQP